MMTRKNYQSAAKIVSLAREQGNPAWREMAEAFAQFFGDDNPAFDVKRFDEACGRFVVRGVGAPVVAKKPARFVGVVRSRAGGR